VTESLIPKSLSAKIIVDVNSEVEKDLIEGMKLQKPMCLQDIFIVEKGEEVNGKRTFEIMIGLIGIGL
jgi:hypothetical protein